MTNFIGWFVAGGALALRFGLGRVVFLCLVVCYWLCIGWCFGFVFNLGMWVGFVYSVDDASGCVLGIVAFGRLLFWICRLWCFALWMCIADYFVFVYFAAIWVGLLGVVCLLYLLVCCDSCG